MEHDVLASIVLTAGIPYSSVLAAGQDRPPAALPCQGFPWCGERDCPATPLAHRIRYRTSRAALCISHAIAPGGTTIL